MPFKSESQRKFLFANEPKVAEEFAEATPKGKDLPEHVKHMADGGTADSMPDIESSAEAFDQGMKHENVVHDSDSVKSYLKSKFNSLLHPGDGTIPVVDTDTTKAPPIGMADGGYPHVTFMEDQTPEEVKKTVHLGPMDPMVARGLPGVPALPGVQPTVREQAEAADKEAADKTMDEKMEAVLKAMGMEKYAVGGVVPQAPVGPQLNMPDQSDPTFWEQIKSALAKASAPITAPIGVASGITNAAMPVIEAGAPGAVSALNSVTGTNLPIPQVSSPKIEDLGAPKPLVEAMPPMAPPAKPSVLAAPKVAPAVGKNELDNLFNQDTSKLTAGVEGSDRQNVAGSMTERQSGVGSILAEALAGLGDAIAAKGGREQHSLKDIFSMQKQQRDEALSNFDKARQARLEKLDLQTKMGNNSIQKLAAEDAYGVDENLNKQLGAPQGTAHKDLPLYMQMMTAKAAQDEKDTELDMKAHEQAAKEVDEAEKGAGIFHMKITPEHRYAVIAKKADQYKNRARGNVLFQPSDGQKPLWIPAKNIEAARKMDPNGQIIP